MGEDVYKRQPYDYYICNVKLENFNLSHVPVYIMSQEQLSMYATYMSVLGNREDLFGDSPYVDKYITCLLYTSLRYEKQLRKEETVNGICSGPEGS